MNQGMTPIRILMIAGATAVTIVAAAYFGTTSREKKNWTLAGGVTGGNYDAVAHAIAKTLENSNEWTVTVLNSTGSRGNLKLLEKTKAEIGLIQNDSPGNDKVQSLATLYQEVLHVIVRDEEITTADLAGAPVSMGPVGGGTEALARAMLAQWGLTGEMDLRNENLKDGLKNLREGKRKALCAVTGIGNPVLHEALARGGLRIMPMGEAPAASLLYKYPFVEASQIPAGAYPVSPRETLPRNSIPTVGVRVVLACHASLPNAHARRLTRSMVEGRSLFARAHPLLGRITTLEAPIGLQFPVHEGARQYYRREVPGFLRKWSDPMALCVSVLVLSWGIGAALHKLILGRRKDRLDSYFERVDELTTELVEGATEERAGIIAQDLHAIRRETTSKLVSEELEPDESFVIFQRQLHTAQQMVNQFLNKDRLQTKDVKG